MKVKVDQNTCIGCGSCESICPKNFKMKQGKSSVVNEEPCKETQDAIDSCPVNAISLK